MPIDVNSQHKKDVHFQKEVDSQSRNDVHLHKEVKRHIRKATIFGQRSNLKLGKVLKHNDGLKVNLQRAFNGKMR